MTPKNTNIRVGHRVTLRNGMGTLEGEVVELRRDGTQAVVEVPPDKGKDEPRRFTRATAFLSRV